MPYRIARTLTATLAATSIAAGVAYASTARPMSTSDATAGADFTATIRPGQRLTIEHQCARGGYFTEFSAYRHDGSALGPQNWREGRTLVYWQGAHGRVTFDGVTWRNETRATAVVKGWCS